MCRTLHLNPFQAQETDEVRCSQVGCDLQPDHVGWRKGVRNQIDIWFLTPFLHPTSDVVTDSGYDTYSESMSGTETYGPGGTVSGGSDSFTWAQTASDNLILTQDYGGTTLGAYTLYDMTVDDQIYQNFSDVGKDILGPSDSILGGGDSYTWGSSRDLVSTITDYGDVATPYLILAYSSDQTGLNQTGTDTLTTNGHIYSTVTYTYNEQTSDNSSVSQSISGTGWIRQGSASDSYSDTDSGTITISDTTTTSFDSFSVTDNHSISGSISATAAYSPGTASWTDTGVDTNGMNASGTKSTTGDVYTFADTESSTDDFLLKDLNRPRSYPRPSPRPDPGVLKTWPGRVCLFTPLLLRLYRLRMTPHPNPPPHGGRGLLGLFRREENNRLREQETRASAAATIPFKTDFSSPHSDHPFTSWGKARGDRPVLPKGARGPRGSSGFSQEGEKPGGIVRLRRCLIKSRVCGKLASATRWMTLRALWLPRQA